MPQLLSVLAFISVLLSCVTGDRCHQEMPVPTNLDMLPEYELTRELHHHGKHRIDLSTKTNITFSITSESYFRAYMSPHQIDIDMYLFKNTTQVDISFTAFREELISKILTAGEYLLELRPLGYETVLSQGEISALDCQWVILEIAIVPQELVRSRQAAYTDCPGQTFLPSNFDFAPLAAGRPFHYDTTEDKFNSRKFNIIPEPSNNTWVSKYIRNFSFTLDPKPGTNPLFKFRSTLGYDFLSGGSLRLVLLGGDGTKDPEACDLFFNDCKFGVNLASNTHTLQTTLGPGNYSLWIVDHPGRRFSDLNICSPVSMQIDLEQEATEENFLSCHAERIPTDLNLPGFIDDTGYLYFRERVFIDLALKSHQVDFTLRAPSFLRVWVEPHRVDIDIDVRGDAGNSLARTVQGAGKAESVIIELEPNRKYSIFFKYYTTLDAFFCESFLLEMSVIPFVPDYNVDVCTGKTTAIPDLNGKLENLSQAYHLAKKTYSYFYSNGTASREAEILRVPLNVTRDMRLSFHIGAPFAAGLTGTLTKVITSVPINGGSNTSVTEAVTTEYNGLRMSTLVSAGQQYFFTLKTGPFQLGILSQTTFPKSPPCFIFDFELSLEPSLMIVMTCDAPSLPDSLNGPQYLGSSNRVHFQDRFLIPTKLSGFDAEEKMTFTVQTESLLRAYTDFEMEGGVSFSLTANGAPANVSRTEVEAGEVSLYATLVPGKTYVFGVQYFNIMFSNLTRCATWNFEFEIAPIPDGITTETCQQEKVPQDSVSLILGGFTTTERKGEYAFSQNSTAYRTNVEFTLWTFTYLRALVFYDFVWGDLTLKLFTNNDTLIITGENDYNKNEIQGVQLPAGTYTLAIMETLAQSRPELRRCVEYTFQIGLTPLSSSNFQPKPQDFTGCPYLSMPSTLDAISYLSDIGGNIVHFSRNVKMDVKSYASRTSFHLEVPSYLRVFIPPHFVDIDVYLSEIDDIGESKIIASSFGYGEELLFKKLEPGNYQLKFTFLTNNQKNYFPDTTACVFFAVEIGIAPVTYVDGKLLLPASSQPTTLPQQLEFNKPTALSVMRHAEPFSHQIRFSTYLDSLFQASVLYPFIPGSIYFSLVGANITSPYLSFPTTRTWSGELGESTSFFDIVLYPGDYVLHLTDKANFSANLSTVASTKFLLHYYLREGEVPENYCDDADVLPKDLFSTEGGSKYYGGPQAVDGSVRITGSHFLVPEANSHNYVLFNIVNTSWVRFWAATPGDNNDIDFMLWKNSSKKTLIEAAVGVDSAESQLTLLEPQSEPYVLDVFTFRRSKIHCSFATFVFTIETNQSAFSRLRCPSPLPNPILPPSRFVVDHTSLIDVYSQDFVFTKQFSDAHLERHWSFNKTIYSVNISVSGGKYGLWAMVGFDFTLTDFTISLYNKSGTPIGQSFGGPPISVNSFVTFESWISADLLPGEYVLKITQKIFRSRPMNAGECARFSFLFNTQYLGSSGEPSPSPAPVGPAPPTVPRIVTVIPPEGNQLDASEPLVIQILFSEAVNSTIPLLYDPLRQWIRSQSFAYLVYNASPAEAPTTMWPSGAVLNSARTQLTVSFFPVSFSRTYTLHINTTSLTNAAGISFAPNPQTYTYRTISCTCGGHGVCSPNATHMRECICDFPYAGPECLTCHDGYHRSGASCLENIPCTTSSCSGHGMCDASAGFPQCKCDFGYENTATLMCAQCQSGYTGFPNCTKKPDDRKTRCTVPLLPTDLSSVGYLHSPPLETFHLQGNYFIDLNHIEHDMAFSLAEDSYFRVYTEPHAVDIDLWLWRKEGTTVDFIANGVTYNQEETLFRLLPKGDYVLSFHFIPTAARVGDCPTFNLELALATVSQFGAENSRIKGDCPTADFLPKLDVPQNVIPITGYSYNPDQQFAVVPTADNAPVSHNFHNITFSVPKNGNRIAQLSVEIGKRFLLGDIAAKLVYSSKNESAVVTGFNSYNKHFLNHFLEEGNYTLMLYFPIDLNKTLVSCAPFSFSLKITFTDEDENIFNCPHPLLPATLNTAPYKGRRVHLFNTFLVENGGTVQFDVSEESFIRVSIASRAYLYYSLQKQAQFGWETITFSSVSGELASAISNGTHRISVDPIFTFDASSITFCPTIDVELVIIPKVDLLNKTRAVVCPPGSVSQLPSLPSQFLTLPFNYKSPVLYSFPNVFGSTISEHNFELSQTVALEAGVASHFLTGNLKIRLAKSDLSFETVYSDSAQEDYNFVRHELSPGNYTLTIYQESVLRGTELACTPFTFDFSVISSVEFKADPCWELNLEPLPPTLSVLRYTSQLENTVELQSDSWKIPAMAINHAKSFVNFSVTTQSLFRIYVADNAVDIDVYLHKQPTSTGLPATQVTGGASQFGEESFVVVIGPGDYFIRFEFYNWGASSLVCGRFTMELSISPVSELPPRESNCPSTATNVWPTIPNYITEFPLLISSEKNGLDYHYQQTDQRGFSKPVFKTDFAISSVSSPAEDTYNLHIELGFNFLLNNLVVELDSATVSKKYFGKNGFNRNVLTVKDLFAGNYNLSFYEAASNTDPLIVGCSHFTFYMLLDKAKPAITRAYSSSDPVVLAENMNSVAYLKYSDNIHLAGLFSVENKNLLSSNHVEFSLNAPSLVRAGVGHGLASLGFLPTDSHTHRTIVGLLNPGPHSIFFFGSTLSNVVTSFTEIQIEPLASAQKIADGHMKCKAPLAVNPNAVWQPPVVAVRPDGSYMFRDKEAYLTAQQLSSSGAVVVSLPFSVTLDSVLSVQLQHSFLLAPLEVVLHYVRPVLGSTRFSTMRYNLADLNVQITPGNYNLTINRLQKWNASENLLGTVQLTCVDMDLLMSISPLGSDDDRVDCSAYTYFPFDLNSDTGGSLGFGGPIKFGTLHLWHNKFLLDDDTKTMKAAFHIANTSMMSVFLQQNTWSDLKISIKHVVANGNNTNVAPITFSSNFLQWVGVYKVPTGDYILQLDYFPTSLDPCSYFSLGLSIQPVDEVLEDLSQACSSSKTPLPPAKLPAVFQSEGYFSAENIQKYTNASTHKFEYPMEFSVGEGSFLDVSFSYNPLAALFTLKLFRSENGAWEDMFEGQWDAVSEEKSFLGLTQQIEYSPIAGNYKLVIEHTLTDKNELPVFVGSGSATKECFPFLLTFQLSSSGAGSVVRSVEPRGGRGYDPSSDIYIEVRFSTPLYTATRDPINRTSQTDVLTKAVVLKPLSSATAPPPSTVSDASDILAEQITAPSNNPTPDDFTRWLFVFNHKSFKFGVAYDLVLLSSSPVYGPDARPVTLVQQYRYEMAPFDTTCAGSGTFNETTTSCVCKPESYRTGIQCEKCVAGYQFDENAKCVPEPVCLPNSCGCLPQSDSSKPCEPIGTCSLVPSKFGSKLRCDCRKEYPQYTGSRCEQCALGYFNYPKCTSLCPACVNGNCSAISSTCVCFGNWAGPTCSECAAGYSGPNCEQKFEGLKAAVIVIVGLLVLAAVGFGLWYFKFRKQKPEYIDDSLELELKGGKKVAGGEAATNPLAGLTDEEEEDEQFRDDLVAGVDDEEDDDDKEKTSLVKLDDYEPAKKTPVNLLS